LPSISTASPFGDAERLERAARHAGDAAAAFLLPRRGDLQPDRALLEYRHFRFAISPLALVNRRCQRARIALPDCKPAGRRWCREWTRRRRIADKKGPVVAGRALEVLGEDA
jgi:hypothetical protein